MKKIIFLIFLTISFKSYSIDQKSYFKHVNQKILAKYSKFQKCLKRSKKKKTTKVIFVLDIENYNPYRVGVFGVDYPVSIRACITEELWSIKFDYLPPNKKIMLEIPFLLKN